MSFIGTEDGLGAIDAALLQTANYINEDVYSYNLHLGPWTDLIPQEQFPEGAGTQLTSMVYDRSLPSKDTGGNTLGVNWHGIGITESSNTLNTMLPQGRQALADATKQFAEPNDGDGEPTNNTLDGDQRSFVQFHRALQPYVLKRAALESPKISLEDLRHATHRDEQIDAIIDLLTEVTQWTWTERNRYAYEQISGNLCSVRTSGTTLRALVDAGAGTATDAFTGANLTDLDFLTSGAGNSDISPNGTLSNAVLDYVYTTMNRRGAGKRAYGMEDGQPVHGLVCSSEASRVLMTETEYRDDIRYSTDVSALIKPLGISRSFRGYYHLVDDTIPRFTISTGVLTEVLPWTITAGEVDDNPAYDTATHEAAYLLHEEVMKNQVPNPFSGAKGISFDPVTYRGDFKWTNIKDAVHNPDGTVGFFRGLASVAHKPCKHKYGVTFVFQRNGTMGA